jgi:hypothetical protein
MSDYPTDAHRRQLGNDTANALDRDSAANLPAHDSEEPLAQSSTTPSEGTLTFICQYCVFMYMLFCLSSPRLLLPCIARMSWYSYYVCEC